MGNIRSKDKLKKDMATEVTKLFHTALDYAQVACPTQDVFLALRSKILRSGNDCIRNLKQDIDRYEIEFIPTMEDIIKFKQ